MKVLLLGEFSGVHNNLKIGLLKYGIDVKVLNNGDGYKKFKSDGFLTIPHGEGLILNIIKFLLEKYYYYKFLQYDVIQFMHPSVLLDAGFSHEFIFSVLKKAKLSIVLCAGCDCQFAKYSDMIGVQTCTECEKRDIRNHKCRYKRDKKYQIYEKNFLNLIDVIIPTTWEYFKIYNDYDKLYLNKLKPIILFPIDTEKIEFDEIGHKKIIVFHPLNREGFKGTAVIRQAFNILKSKYQNLADFIIDGKMPYDKYYEFIKKVDIIVDQLHSKTYGMSSLIGMAQGKVIMTGDSRESRKDSRTRYMLEAPILDIGYTVDDIVIAISKLLENPDNINQLKIKGRKYAIKYHDTKLIARKYINLYKSEINSHK